MNAAHGGVPPVSVRAGNTRLIRQLVNLFLARFSPGDIEKSTRHPLRIGLCGDPEAIWDFRDMLVAGTVERDQPFPSLSLHPLPTDDPQSHWSVLDDCQMAVVLLQREHLLGDTIHRIHETVPRKVPAIWAAVGHVEPWLRYEVGEIARDLSTGGFIFLEDFTPHGVGPLLTEMIKAGGGYDLAMARKMPLLRDAVATRLIHRTARHNLMIAMASALPASLPWIGPIVGLIGVTGEIIFITSAQLRMALQVASIYGYEMNVKERVGELLPIVGGAFGWRTLSRELVGFIPVAGPGVKGSIAYAGTVATGEAARWYYKTGRSMDPGERRHIFEEAYRSAGDLSRRFSDWFLTLRDPQKKAFLDSLAATPSALPGPSGAPVLEPPLEAEPEKVAGFRVDSHEDERAYDKSAGEEPAEGKDA